MSSATSSGSPFWLMTIFDLAGLRTLEGPKSLLNRRGNEPCSQFHQHFTSSFCIDIFATKKLQSKTVIKEDLGKAILCSKVTRKVLMKLTPGERVCCGFRARRVLEVSGHTSRGLRSHVPES